MQDEALPDLLAEAAVPGGARPEALAEAAVLAARSLAARTAGDLAGALEAAERCLELRRAGLGVPTKFSLWGSVRCCSWHWSRP